MELGLSVLLQNPGFQAEGAVLKHYELTGQHFAGRSYSSTHKPHKIGAQIFTHTEYRNSVSKIWPHSVSG